MNCERRVVEGRVVEWRVVEWRVVEWRVVERRVGKGELARVSVQLGRGWSRSFGDFVMKR